MKERKGTMGIFRDLTGLRVGFLEVIEQAPDRIEKSGRHRKMWKCLCHNCGGETVITSDAILGGQQVSCGCYHKQRTAEINYKHGATDTRLYYVWNGIKTRCYSKNTREYQNYGARGITMCDDWHYDFSTFAQWAYSNGYDESAPRGQCTIDRIDVNGGYEPNNCRVVSQIEQMQNTRTNHYLTYNGDTLTIAEWSRRTGIRPEKIRNRVNHLGWTPERALTEK